MLNLRTISHCIEHASLVARGWVRLGVSATCLICWGFGITQPSPIHAEVDVNTVLQSWSKTPEKIPSGFFRFSITSRDTFGPNDREEFVRSFASAYREALQREDPRKREEKVAEFEQVLSDRASCYASQGYREQRESFDAAFVDERNFVLQMGDGEIQFGFFQKGDIVAVITGRRIKSVTVCDLSTTKTGCPHYGDALRFQSYLTDWFLNFPYGSMRDFGAQEFVKRGVVPQLSSSGDLLVISFDDGKLCAIFTCSAEPSYRLQDVSFLDKQAGQGVNIVAENYQQVLPNVWRPQKIVWTETQRIGDELKTTNRTTLDFSFVECLAAMSNKEITREFEKLLDGIDMVEDRRAGEPILYKGTEISPASFLSHFMRKLSPEEKSELKRQAAANSFSQTPKPLPTTTLSTQTLVLLLLGAASLLCVILTIFFVIKRKRN